MTVYKKGTTIYHATDTGEQMQTHFVTRMDALQEDHPYPLANVIEPHYHRNHSKRKKQGLSLTVRFAILGALLILMRLVW